ncbi:restriction endonuclease subunit S [Thiothrix nivea]|uniref:Restriction modification system DNA specificity domain-containing protein n=1 Tax=Thiothrix nivea (strain ATCC 35100 / DSM 5205 / JP2) TaxID=870187 RepID=A0A656HC88_THINJ|nr:restriction endonuclease subunit S [Thiothrix nivea]EIJ34488.1 restriction modification system DNA specificity domain-containing protein [Thiothrix nivea DSM 5205]
MSKPEKKALVPALRFPEFQDAGGWEEKKLGEFLTESRVLGNKGDVAKKITVKLWGKGVYEKNEVIEGSINTQYYYRKAGQFIYSKLDFLNQAFGIIPNHLDGYESTVDLPCFDINGNLNPIFLLEYVKQKGFYEKQGEAADGSRKAKRIHADTFLLFPILIPIKKEQQKIADCLSSIDDLITAQTQKLAALKAHKKGLMQQLFPAEGETVPRLRFPEFRDGGEWDEVLFGSIIKINSGKGFKASEYSKNGIRLLQIENVGYGIVKWSDNAVYLPQNYTIKYSGLVLHEGDIVLALNRPVTNGELKIARLKKNDDPSLLYQRVGKLELLSDDINEDFAFHLCQIFVKDFVIKQSIGSDQPFISITTLYAQVITIPSSSLEQQKIADCLSTIDELITAQSQKIEALKSHKKGLMQQLFPAVDNHPTPSGHPSTGGELRQQHSPPVEGWTAKLDGVVSPTAEDS